MARFLAFFSTICLIGLLVGIVLYLGFYGPGARFHRLDSAGVVKEIRPLNELLTVRYSIEKVVGMREEKSPVGEESILLLVRGRVLAGVDLGELKASDVTVVDRESVRIHLGAPHIEEAYLDEKYTKVWDRSITWWTPWVMPDPELEHKARMQALDEIRAEAVNMGIIDQARRDAEGDIRDLLQAFGIRKVAFGYGD